MSEFFAPLATAISLVLVVGIVCAAALAGWRGWLDLKRLELGQTRSAPLPEEKPEGDAGVLIEVAAVKERLRRLEAIASGVDL